MNGNEFFIRFNLQRSSGIFYDDGFPFWKLIDYTEKETKKYIASCEQWIDEQAGVLNTEMDLSSLKGKNVLYVGDSLTADRLSYCALTQKACEFKGMNAAVSGATSADMVRFIYDNIQASKPDIISILIGANDSLMLDKSESVISKAEYRKNISIMLKKSIESGARVIIGTPPCINEDIFNSNEMSIWRSNTNKNIDSYADIVREEANKCGVLLNDINKLVKELGTDNFTEDGVHLTKEVHIEVARNWIKKLLKF